MSKLKNLVAGAILACILPSCASSTKSYSGTVKEGPYSGTQYEISETPTQRNIRISSNNDYIVHEALEIIAIDKGKDGIYEIVTVNLEGKDISRSIGHVPTDLASIIEEAKINK